MEVAFVSLLYANISTTFAINIKLLSLSSNPHDTRWAFIADSMELIHLSSFCMTYSLRFLLILSHQIRWWRKFGKHIIYSINLPHHLQQEKKSGKRKIARCTILKLVDGGQAKPSKLGNLFLGESRLQMPQIRPSLHHSHIDVFLEKSLNVSLFANISLIHNELQNDTSKYIYKEVS